jgi:hypothetical protein
MDAAGLYLAAAVYVPLALCFGIWGGTFGVTSMAMFGIIPLGNLWQLILWMGIRQHNRTRPTW